jgi:hypothetical protein
MAQKYSVLWTILVLDNRNEAKHFYIYIVKRKDELNKK